MTNIRYACYVLYYTKKYYVISYYTKSYRAKSQLRAATPTSTKNQNDYVCFEWLRKVQIAHNTMVCALSLKFEVLSLKFKVWSLGFKLHKTQRCVLERGLLPHLSVLAAPYTRGHTRVFFLIVRTSSLSLLSSLYYRSRVSLGCF